jgi:methanogenic corrinoid protein MtbC1
MKRYMGEAVPAAQAAELAKSARLTLQPGRTAQLQDDDAVMTARQMSDALDVFDESSAEHALQQLMSEYSPLAVIRDLLMPYLYDVGERRAADHMTVAQEHFASNFVHSRLLALARGWDRGLGPGALLACAPGELHTLALIAFGIALHAHGWKITYLGAATPIDMLVAVATQVHTDLIVVTSSVTGGLHPFLDELRPVAGRWRLLIAGSATEERLAAQCGAAHVAEDPVTAAASIAATAGFEMRRPRGRNEA